MVGMDGVVIASPDERRGGGREGVCVRSQAEKRVHYASGS